MGVARYTKDVFKEVEKNYPQSSILESPLYPSFNGMIRYARPLRSWMMGSIEENLLSYGIDKNKIYWCME
jgi:spore photoproduct lyase